MAETTTLIDQQLCEIAIDQCDTRAFEKFAQAFHAALVGSSFVPLGGNHDGGADGFEEAISESQSRPGTFLQASKTSDFEAKIKTTVKRLKAFCREPKVVRFYFSHPIPIVDQLEELMTNETDVTIQVRGKQFIASHINSNLKTEQAFRSYLEGSVQFLQRFGSANPSSGFPFETRTLCAFLGQEVNRRRGNATLLTSITDSFILWALEGTDPDQKKFATRAEILAKIIEAIPTAEAFIKGTLDGRLQALTAKNNSSGRQISWHKKQDVFALRYEQRQKLIADNIEEAGLLSATSDEFRIAARELLPKRLHNRIEDIVSVVHRCIETLYMKQGVALSLYVMDQNDDALASLSVNEIIEEFVGQLALTPANRRVVLSCVSGILAKAIYSPSVYQRDYMLRLSRTYFLMFVLKNDARVVEYFNGMTRQLVLYVGSDILLKAMSEHYLPPAGRLASNALDVIQKAGSTLVLAEPAFEEVYTHLRATDLEFRNYYMQVEHLIDETFAHSIDRILIRAYFYARLGLNTDQKRPQGWRSYVNQFCSYDGLLNFRSRDGLRRYLCDKFGLKFEDREKIRASVDRDQLRAMTNAIIKARQLSKKKQAVVLAYNDALHALRVFSRRDELGEVTAGNPFGYKCWWLTQEKAVQRAAVFALGPGVKRFILRPEFLLNYLGLNPTTKQVSESYKLIFPTVLGVSLSKRVPPAELHTVLKAARESFEVDESRAKAMIAEFSERLMTDQMRRYEVNLP